LCQFCTYAKPENRTRALTLVRLAVNLGFAGPALGGLIIMEWDIKIVWVDGSSCVIAILIFALLVKEKKNFSERPKCHCAQVAQYLKKIF
jgi:predicted MFS family arabinose efflux permease